MKAKKSQPIKILIADDDRQLARSLVTLLKENNFEAHFTNSGTEAKSMIARWKPRFVLADLMLPEQNALSLLKFIKTDPSLKAENIDLCVLSGHNNPENVKSAFQNGAIDYIVKPFKLNDLLGRLVLHCREHRELTEVKVDGEPPKNSAAYWLQITNLLVTQATNNIDVEERLFNLTRMATLMLRGVRCSVVRFINQSTGLVVTSNDDKEASGISLNLNKYPEIQLVTNTNSMLAIDNIDTNPAMRGIRQHLTTFSFNSIVVCPVHYRGEVFGVLSMRMPSTKRVLTDNEIRFVDLVAKIVSLTISTQDMAWLDTQVPRAA